MARISAMAGLYRRKALANKNRAGTKPVNKVNMLIDLLGKILFSRQPVWLHRKQIKTIVAVALTAVFFGLMMAGFMLYAAFKK